MEGWLQKKNTTVFGGWRLRWFDLRYNREKKCGMMRYYLDNGQTKARNYIYIIDSNTIVTKVESMGSYNNCFQLQSTVISSDTNSLRERVIIVSAETPELELQWIDRIIAFKNKHSESERKQKIENILKFVGKVQDNVAIDVMEKFIKCWVEGNEEVYNSTVIPGIDMTIFGNNNRPGASNRLCRGNSKTSVWPLRSRMGLSAPIAGKPITFNIYKNSVCFTDGNNSRKNICVEFSVQRSPGLAQFEGRFLIDEHSGIQLISQVEFIIASSKYPATDVPSLVTNENTDLELESVAGFTERVTASTVQFEPRYRSPEYENALNSLSGSLQNLNLNEKSNAEIFAKYPEYISLPEMLRQNNDEGKLMSLGEYSYSITEFVTVTFRLPSKNGKKINPINLVVSIKETLSSLMERFRVKLGAVGGRQFADIDNRILKVVGLNEYLIRHQFPLFMFDCFIRAVRLEEPVPVVLLAIPEEDYSVLESTILQSVDDYIVGYLGNYGPDAETKFIDAPRSVNTEVTSAIIAQHSVITPWFIQIHQIRFPTNDTNSFEKLKSFEKLYVQIRLLYNGEDILDKPLQSDPIMVQQILPSGAQNLAGAVNLPFPHGAINSGLDFSTIPPTTRVVLTVVGECMGHVKITKTPIAQVSVVLFNYLNQLNYSNFNQIGDVLMNPKYYGPPVGSRGRPLPLFNINSKSKNLNQFTDIRMSSVSNQAGPPRSEVNPSSNKTSEIVESDNDEGDDSSDEEKIRSSRSFTNFYDRFTSRRLSGTTSVADSSTPVTSSRTDGDNYDGPPSPPTSQLSDIEFWTPGANDSDPNAITLYVSFDWPFFDKLIIYENNTTSLGTTDSVKVPTEQEKKLINELIKLDQLECLSDEEKSLLWECREYCKDFPDLLTKFLRSVRWTDPASVVTARQLLLNWAPLGNPIDYMELFDVRYSDPVVRQLAVVKLSSLDDTQLQEVLLQLVQAVKVEAYHNSPLSRFLLRRALLSPLVVGHYLFWLLRSEMHLPVVQERYGTLLMTYLQSCGPHLKEVMCQVQVDKSLRELGWDVVKLYHSKELKKAKDEKKSIILRQFREGIEELNRKFPATLSIALTPKFKGRCIIADKCKIMSSKKKPMWIVFENDDPEGDRFTVIFKVGDDLRQDQLVLQLFRIMDKLWRAGAKDIGDTEITEDMDSREVFDQYLTKPVNLRMKPYGCCATGNEAGMLEVVMHAREMADMHYECGKCRVTGTLGVFDHRSVSSYLALFNQGDSLDRAIDNFTRSTAGYVVATCILGIGDRHSSNIMVTEQGHLFHIDFGHILGHFKSKLGIKRERNPFVFSPEMAYAITKSYKLDEKFRQENSVTVPLKEHAYFQKVKENYAVSNNYIKFEAMCCRAYNELRKHSNLFLTLFALMLPARMPELTKRKSIEYISDMLRLEKTDDASDNILREDLKKSMRSISRQFDNFFHGIKHKATWFTEK